MAEDARRRLRDSQGLELAASERRLQIAALKKQAVQQLQDLAAARRAVRCSPYHCASGEEHGFIRIGRAVYHLLVAMSCKADVGLICGHVCRIFQADLQDTAALLQDAPALKSAVKAMYLKHAADAALPQRPIADDALHQLQRWILATVNHSC